MPERRYDAEEKKGMATERTLILLRCILRRMSRNGSSGLRDGASLLLRPWMTKSGAASTAWTLGTNENSRRDHLQANPYLKQPWI
jgi:hypothetical protein